jgi:hypothetical protein
MNGENGRPSLQVVAAVLVDRGAEARCDVVRELHPLHGHRADARTGEEVLESVGELVAGPLLDQVPQKVT